MSGYPIWMNIAIYQAIWFCGVLGKERLVVVMFLLLAVHFYLVKDRVTEVLIVAGCGLVGILVDSALTLLGVFEFSPTPSLLPIPFWLLGIWFGFAATFRHGLSFFFARPKLLVVIAAIGAPFTYIAASRLGAVSLPFGYLSTALVMTVVWALLMVCLYLITQYLSRSSPSIRNADINVK